MTNEQINHVIARACGWEQDKKSKKWWTKDNISSNAWDFNYVSDLNQMQEAERSLKNLESYTAYLVQICGGPERVFSATARERAIAFVCSIGEWSELIKKNKIDRMRNLMLEAAQKLDAYTLDHDGCDENCNRVGELVNELRKEAQP